MGVTVKAFYWICLLALCPILAQADSIYTSRAYDPAAAMYDRAAFFEDKGLYLAAAFQYEKCAAQFNQHHLAIEAQTQAGVCYTELGQYAMADELFKAIWARRGWMENPLVANELYLSWIKTKISLGEIDEAQKLYAAFTMSRSDPYFLSRATFLIAEHFYLNGRQDLALAYLNYQQIFGTSRAYALYLQATIALEAGNDAQAAAYLQQLADFPINMRDDLREIAMLKDTARYKLALLAYEQQNYPQAIARYQGLENEALYGGDKALGQAWCYFHLEQYPQAEDRLKLIFEKYPEYQAISEANFLAGVVSMHVQKFPQAINAFQGFLEIFGDYKEDTRITVKEEELKAEQHKLADLKRELVDLERRLADLNDHNALRFVDLIESKRQALDDDLGAVQKMLNTLAQRRSELPLLVEAEYGIAKAQLQMNLAEYDSTQNGEVKK